MKNLPDWWEKVRFSRFEQKTEESPSVDDDYEKLAEAVVNEFMETLRGR